MLERTLPDHLGQTGANRNSSDTKIPEAAEDVYVNTDKPTLEEVNMAIKGDEEWIGPII